jgi:hypothetical protein
MAVDVVMCPRWYPEYSVGYFNTFGEISEVFSSSILEGGGVFFDEGNH